MYFYSVKRNAKRKIRSPVAKSIQETEFKILANQSRKVERVAANRRLILAFVFTGRSRPFVSSYLRFFLYFSRPDNKQWYSSGFWARSLLPPLGTLSRLFLSNEFFYPRRRARLVQKGGILERIDSLSFLFLESKIREKMFFKPPLFWGQTELTDAISFSMKGSTVDKTGTIIKFLINDVSKRINDWCATSIPRLFGVEAAFSPHVMTVNRASLGPPGPPLTMPSVLYWGGRDA